MKTKNILIIGLTTTILLSNLTLNATQLEDNNITQQSYSIKLTHVVSDTTPKGKAALFFASRVKELSNSKVEIKVYPNSQLYGDADELKAIKLNYAQIAIPSFSKLSSYVPDFQVLDLPFIFSNILDVHEKLDGTLGSILKTKLDNKGFKTLDFWDAGFKQLSTNNNFTSINDLNNLKMRIMASPVLEEQFRSINSTPIVLPFAEVYKAMKNNIVDGSENPISNFYSKKFYEVQHNIILSNHGYLGYIVVFNKKYWNDLPQQYQQVIIQALKEATEYERKETELDNHNNLMKLKEYANNNSENFKIIELNQTQQEQLSTTMKTIYKKFDNIIEQTKK